MSKKPHTAPCYYVMLLLCIVKQCFFNYKNMCDCKESSSKQDLDVVIIHSSASVSEANSLRDGLKRRDGGLKVVVRNADEAGVEWDAVLRHCIRCIMYLSPQPVNDLCKSAVLCFADREGRDAVVVVMDDALETSPGEWAYFLCLRYVNHCLRELCRELELLIRTPLLPCRPQDITGYAAAFRVRYGYLRFVLPNFHVRLKELYPSVYASCVKKLLIICPESCRCPVSMMIEGSIENANQYVLRNVPRAGQPHRELCAPVYLLRDKERNRDYYFPAEFDNFLVSLSDIQMSGLAGIDENQMHRERNNYILHLQQLLQHSKDARQLSGQYRILYWRNLHNVSLDEFLLPIVREELESETEVFESSTDFQCVDGRGVNPGSLYASPAECYKLDSEPKGICLIINITEFESSATATTHNNVPRNLGPRTGTEADVRQLTGVFQWLKFKVEVHGNVNKSDFLRIINDTKELDHTAYDAFVCCIMSHGYLGHICTKDQSVRILEDIAQAFYPESCPTLAGKPKIFFIQSCQISGTGILGSVAGQATADDGEFCASEITNCESDAEKFTAPDVSKRTLLLPDAPDFFMSYSTLPRCLSFRQQQRGCFYVQALTEVLKKGLGLQASLDEVTQRVEREAADSGLEGKQRPFWYVSTDHKSVFLCGELLVLVFFQ